MYWSVMSLPTLAFRGRVIYSRTASQVERSAEEILHLIEEKRRKEEKVALGFDIEWRPSFIKGVSPGKAAVMQICGDMDSCYVFHIIHSGISQKLQSLLENSEIPKVGVGIAGDAKKASIDHNVCVSNLEDLSALAKQKFKQGPSKWSLASLAEKILHAKLPKGNNVRLGNWETKFLSKKQLDYAATDAYISWILYQARLFATNVRSTSNLLPLSNRLAESERILRDEELMMLPDVDKEAIGDDNSVVTGPQ